MCKSWLDVAKDLKLNMTNKDGETPLSLAVDSETIECVQFLLDNGADPNCKGLGKACDIGSYEIASSFLKAGADPNKTHGYKVLPLCAAAQSGNVDLVKLLVKHGADPKAVHGEKGLVSYAKNEEMRRYIEAL